MRAASRLAVAVASNGVSLVIAAVQSFVLVPFFLLAWGADGYGLWLTLTAGIYYLTLLDFGGQLYVQNVLSEAHARCDRDAFRNQLSQGLSLFCFAALAALLLIAALIGITSTFHAAEVMRLLGRDTPWILGLMAASMLVMLPLGILTGTYRAAGFFTRSATIGNVMRSLELAAFVLLLWAKCTPLQFALATLVSTALRAVVTYVDLVRTVPEARSVQVSLEAALQGRTLVAGSLQFWFYAVAGMLNQQGMLIVLGVVAPPAAVALYSTHRTATGVVAYAGTLLLGPLWPELSRLFSLRHMDQVRRVSTTAIQLVFLASGIIAIALFVLLPVFYPLWTGRTLALDRTLLGLLLFQAVLGGAWTTAGWPLLAANRSGALAGWSVTNGVLTLILAGYFASRFGVHGAATATLTADLVCGLAVFPFLTARFLEVPLRRFWRSLLPVASALFATMLIVLAADRVGRTTAVVTTVIALLVLTTFGVSIVMKNHALHIPVLDRIARRTQASEP